MAKKTKAAIYCRISRDMTGQHKGVDRQREDCEWTCHHNGWEIVGVYTDNSTSAYSPKPRPEYDQMIADYKAGKFDVIVAWKVDRLTRSVRGFEEMLNELESQGLRICTTDIGDQDLSKSDTKFLIQLMVSFAEFESARKSERSKRANEQRAKEGKIKPGTRCFGYDGDFNVIPEEAEVVRAIYDQYLKGASMNAISRAIAGGTDPSLPSMPLSDAPSVIFAREKSKPVPDLTWTLAITQTILRNPKYAGYVAYVPSVNGKCQSPMSHWTDFIVRDDDGDPIPAAWPAIVTPDEWWTVQGIRDKNRYRSDGSTIDRKGNTRKHFGAGVYRCGICGGPMHSGDKSYRCDGHVNRMRGKVDKFVLTVIRERLSQPDLKKMLVKTDEPRLKEIEAELSNLRGRIAQTENDYTQDLINARVYRSKTDTLQTKVDKLESERLALLPDNPANNIIAAADPVAAFNAITDPGQIAAIINSLCTVTLDPHPRGKRATPQSLRDEIHFTWKA